MKWTSTYQHPDNLNFVIQSEVFTNTSTNEELEWYYVYVYENPEFYKMKSKQRYEANKDEINKRRREKYREKKSSLVDLVE